MNLEGDYANRRSLLAQNIFMSLTLLQILSNCAVGFCLVFILKSCPVGFFFEAFFFVLVPKKKASIY
jgi:hypothetical protein